MDFKSVSKRFATSWWLSPACALGCALAAAALLGLAAMPLPKAVSDALMWPFLGFLGLMVLFGLLSLAVAVRLAWRREWKGALATLLALGTVTLAGGIAGGAVLFLATFVYDGDHFADGLAIPEGIEITEPGEYRWPGDPDGSGGDPYFAAVAAAVAVPGTDDATLSADAPSLARLAAEHRDLLLRYLCMHPAWRVFEDRGKLCATRTMRRGGEWVYSLHGNQTNWRSGGAAQWQTRLTIGFPDPWVPARAAKTRFALGETKKVDTDLVVIDAGNACLEILEQSDTPERRITKALVRLVEDELRPLADAPTEETLRAILPPDAITRGAPDIALRDSFQGGLYDATFRANPGEPGLAWLKAFEVTKGTPLSVSRLPEYSNVRLGWSDDPAELFTGVSHFTIYEGDWGQYYAARFELWFRPDSGAPERKLAERTFKIQGWMR